MIKQTHPHYELIETGITTGAQTYHFTARDPATGKPTFGWALISVNDRLGTLQIMSDFGQWQFGWNPKHLGAESLTDFLADRSDVGYLVGKLANGDNGRVFSADATVEKLIERLKDARRSDIAQYGREHSLDTIPDGYLTHDEFEELCEDLRSVAVDTGDGDANGILFFERIPDPLARGTHRIPDDQRPFAWRPESSR
jgi:hypothetical protein